MRNVSAPRRSPKRSALFATSSVGSRSANGSSSVSTVVESRRPAVGERDALLREEPADRLAPAPTHVRIAEVHDEERGVGHLQRAGEPGHRMLRRHRRQVDELEVDVLVRVSMPGSGYCVVNGYSATGALDPVSRACSADLPELGGPIERDLRCALGTDDERRAAACAALPRPLTIALQASDSAATRLARFLGRFAAWYPDRCRRATPRRAATGRPRSPRRKASRARPSRPCAREVHDVVRRHFRELFRRPGRERERPLVRPVRALQRGSTRARTRERPAGNAACPRPLRGVA